MDLSGQGHPWTSPNILPDCRYFDVRQLADLIDRRLQQNYWPGYFHCYPHKRAYRAVGSLPKLSWASQPDEINLYVHVPFCRMACSFCNLFKTTISGSEADLCQRYVDQVRKEIAFVGGLLSRPTIKSIYFGGGTPNVLTALQLQCIVACLKEHFGKVAPDIVPCIECSPSGLDRQFVSELKEMGFKRISVGVQSFSPGVISAVARQSTLGWIEPALESVRAEGLDLNVDLIYGLPNQGWDEALADLSRAISYEAASICIFPLAIRELTQIASKRSDLPDRGTKYTLWEECHSMLCASGYRMETYVRYSRTGSPTYQQQDLEFSCVPTVGVGAGARSYSPSLHYCLPYKVRQGPSRNVVNQYLANEFPQNQYIGFVMDENEQQRHFVIMYLLGKGVSRASFTSRFGRPLQAAFDREIRALELLELVQSSSESITLTQRGRKYSDVTAEVFSSTEVQRRISEYDLD